MFYVHSRECDSFYELSKAGFRSLPPYVREMLGSRRSNAKVRITRHQITGNTLAQIVKIHLADLDVYSPNTEFDYRVSINLEANLKGNWRDLVMPAALNGETLKRKMNRMSYKHLAYQIDLTQVLLSDVSRSSSIHLDLELIVTAGRLQSARVGSRDVHGRNTQARHTLERRPAQRVRDTGPRLCEQHQDFGQRAQICTSMVAMIE